MNNRTSVGFQYIYQQCSLRGLTGADDRARVCEAVSTQEASRDAHVQQERSHLQAR